MSCGDWDLLCRERGLVVRFLRRGQSFHVDARLAGEGCNVITKRVIVMKIGVLA